MRIKLHRPRRGVWNVALLLFIVGVVGIYLPVPILSGFAVHLVVLAAALLLLGTWVF